MCKYICVYEVHIVIMSVGHMLKCVFGAQRTVCVPWSSSDTVLNFFGYLGSQPGQPVSTKLLVVSASSARMGSILPFYLFYLSLFLHFLRLFCFPYLLWELNSGLYVCIESTAPTEFYPQYLIFEYDYLSFFVSYSQFMNYFSINYKLNHKGSTYYQPFGLGLRGLNKDI